MPLQRLATLVTPLPATGQQRELMLKQVRLFAPFAILLALVIAIPLMVMVTLRNPHQALPLLWVTFGLVGFALSMVFFVAMAMHRELFRPLTEISEWAARIRAGNLNARLPVSNEGEFRELTTTLNDVGELLHALSMDMETQVCRQTERIEQKKRSLQVLYDVAASLNVSRDLNDLLTRFLHTMHDIVDARAGTVRMLNESGQMELVASIGLDEAVVERERFVPVDRCLCGCAAVEGEVMFQSDLKACSLWLGRPILDDADEMEMIAVPLQYRGENLGVYNLFVAKAGMESRDEIRALFTSVGRHLGMAIEKSRLDSEAKRLFIMQERTALAHELHDSLAQTLASLRFQVSMLVESVEKGANCHTVLTELADIKHGLDDGYTELRELLAHFRAPINTRGLLPALEDLVNSLRKQTGMYVLLQKEDWDSSRLPVDLEMQVLRIVQEALANVRKHSKAQTVRVMLRSDADGNYKVLVEDDGVGLTRPAFSGLPGEQIGQAIMQERARRLGGELTIESEPGEGTLLQLTFRYPLESTSPAKESRVVPIHPDNRQ